jgi:hypothetical protein
MQAKPECRNLEEKLVCFVNVGTDHDPAPLPWLRFGAGGAMKGKE